MSENADSTAGSQVRTNQKDERQLSDDLSALLTKASGICGVLRFTGDLGVPSAELGDAMWAVQDILDEAKEITDQLHEVYREMKQFSNSLIQNLVKPNAAEDQSQGWPK